MMDYNVPLGKLNRGMAVLDVAQSLAEAQGGKGELSEQEVFRANALGWCIEFLQVWLVIAGDSVVWLMLLVV